MAYTEGWLILLIALGSALFSEAVNWLFVYRTATYKNLRSNIDKATKKLEVMKGQPAAVVKAKGKSKKMDRVDSYLKDTNQALSATRFRTSIVVYGIMFFVFSIMNTLFDGKMVAKLPFTPIAIFRPLSHRNLPGEDFTDCSMVFLYAIAGAALRPNVQKLLGFSPPRPTGQTVFGMPIPDTAKDK
eukprot:TRINITY_DN15505_c0_g1_i1.p1 TRINITY_DN15505_c0_g1~~TRINITY_DN15505_c0_g1_i1.p1  ORF type:complete len:186 (+),score=39.96 TRINITY_DN15505_c0_g1_i1:220-777(+)